MAKRRRARAKSGTPVLLRRLAFGAVAICVLAGANAVYQVGRRPAQLFGAVDAGFYKDPRTTWEVHGEHFRDFATPLVPADLLAAIAQAETRGNSIAHTHWVWRWSWNPLRWYGPASSATGLFQITDGTFEAARKYCIRHGRVLTDGAWFDVHACWFNAFYNRLFPSHATELTAAYLHLSMEKILGPRAARTPDAARGDLAAVIHLCGPQRGEAFAKARFTLRAGERCGDTDPSGYVKRVREYRKTFRELAGAR